MGIKKEQLISALSKAKQYTDDESVSVEQRMTALIQGLYDIFMEKTDDTLQLLTDNVGIEDTPVGHVMAYMGTRPPKHYLACDGSVYNIIDYPALSSHILNEFGTVNYFGGDGETTFAVPDLRNEFLRGYHGEKEEQLSGEVGKHQPATEHHRLITDIAGSGAKYLQIPMSGFSDSVNTDANINPSRTYMNIFASTYNTYDGGAANERYITSRPTNVAVLYCIKYEHTYYLRSGPPQDYYTLDEVCVGTYMDKPRYRKGISRRITTNGGDYNMGIVPEFTEIDQMVRMYGTIIETPTGVRFPFPYVHDESIYCIGGFINTDGSVNIRVGSRYTKFTFDVTIFVEYTKK